MPGVVRWVRGEVGLGMGECTCVPESCDDGGCEEGEGALGDDVGDVGEVVEEHTRVEAGLEEFAAGGGCLLW